MHKFTEPLRECMTICRNFILAFTFTLLSSVYVCAQVDTIHIGKIRSSVPIIGKLADLPYLFNGKGKWCYGTFNQEIKYYPCSIHDEQTIYVYHVNTIHDKRTRTSYCSDKDGNIRLWYLDFKLAKGSFTRRHIHCFGANPTRAANIHPPPSFPQGVGARTSHLALGYRALQAYGLCMAPSALSLQDIVVSIRPCCCVRKECRHMERTR